MNTLIYKFYPKLKVLEERYKKDTNSVKILILGGSAVAENLYCNLEDELIVDLNRRGYKDNISVYNIAESGHTSLDSKLKVMFLLDKFFNYVIVYDGFNDCRANNIPSEYFDENYNHFSYYKFVNLLSIHNERKITIVPFALEYIYMSISERINNKPKIPPFYIVRNGKVEFKSFWEDGCNIKTEKSLNKNLQYIYDCHVSKNKGKMILSSYAYYLPENYTLSLFYNKKLDYSEQKWPIEIYGDPMCIQKCIKYHNDLIEKWKYKDGVLFIDMNGIVPHNKKYFNDICHLTFLGCDLYAKQICDLIIKNEVSN